jgi:hypothetical protein
MSRGLIVGTGPSLRDQLDLIPRFDGIVFICNNSFEDIHHERMVHLACDPKWHATYSPVVGDFDKWHWSLEVCEKYGYRYIEGVWVDGLWLKDKTKISLNHCSGAQLLNLAVNQYECSEVILIGHDFKYTNGNRGIILPAYPMLMASTRRR